MGIVERDLPHMTSAMGWGRGYLTSRKKRKLISCVVVTVTDGGGGAKIQEFCRHHILMVPMGLAN